MHLPTLRFLVAGFFVATFACPIQAEDDPVFTALVTVAVIPEQVWQEKLVLLDLKANELLERTKKLTTVSEVSGTLQGLGEVTFTNGKLLTFTDGWESPGDDPAQLKPESTIERVIGTEVRLGLLKPHTETKDRRLKLSLTHTFGEPMSHLVNYGAAAKSAEERLKLSAPLPIFDELQWSGETPVTPGKTSLIASMRRHSAPAADAKDAQRCLIFVQLNSQPK